MTKNTSILSLIDQSVVETFKGETYLADRKKL